MAAAMADECGHCEEPDGPGTEAATRMQPPGSADHTQARDHGGRGRVVVIAIIIISLHFLCARICFFFVCMTTHSPNEVDIVTITILQIRKPRFRDIK